jgi:hypothetical protein
MSKFQPLIKIDQNLCSRLVKFGKYQEEVVKLYSLEFFLKFSVASFENFKFFNDSQLIPLLVSETLESKHKLSTVDQVYC